MKLAVFTKNRTNPAYAAARLGADRAATRLGARSMPAGVSEKLNADPLRTLSSREAAEEFKKLGIGMIGNSPAEAAKFIASETEKWERVVKAAKMQVD